MPGVERLSIDLLCKLGAEAVDLGIPMFALFPVVGQEHKSLLAEAAWDPNGLVQRAIKALKSTCPCARRHDRCSTRSIHYARPGRHH